MSPSPRLFSLTPHNTNLSPLHPSDPRVGLGERHTSPRTLRYGASVALVALVTLLGLPLRPWIAPTNLVMGFLLAVVVAAIRLGRGPAVLTAVLGVLCFDFFLVPPHLTFAVSEAQYLLTFAGLLGVGLVISALVAETRGKAEAAQQREQQTAALFALSRALAGAGDLAGIVAVLQTFMVQTFSRQATLFLPNPEGLVPFQAAEGAPSGAQEEQLLVGAFQTQQATGRGTETAPQALARFLPLRGADATPLGVLRIAPLGPATALPGNQRDLLETASNLAALAIERAQLADKARQAQLLQETERLQTALLNSISHDLRTPLASITGALSSLIEDQAVLTAPARRSLIETASEEADRLNRLVGNLLNMSRMEAGAMRVLCEPYDVQDLVGVALAQLGDRLRDRALDVQLPHSLPLVPMDFILMEQVLVNLLDNALKYSPTTTPLTLAARVAAPMLEIEVADRGIGIPNEEQERIFEKFYRVPRTEGDGASGTGLGLSISRGIVEAHGGRLDVQTRPGGGSCFRIALPLGDE